jgi:hypothetical protein
MSSLRSNLRPRVLLPTAILASLGIGVGAFAFSGTPGGGGGGALPPIVQPAKKSEEPAATLAQWRKDANGICATLTHDTANLGTPQSQAELLQRLPASLQLAEAALQELEALPAPKAQRKEMVRMLKLFGRFVALEREAVAALQAADVTRFGELTAEAFAANDRGNAIARELGARRCAVGGTDDTKLARELKRKRVVVAVLYAPDSNVDSLTIREARAGASLSGAGFVAVNVYDAQAIAPLAAQYSVRAAPSVFVFARSKGAVSQFGGYVDREMVAQAADTAAL